MDLAAQRLAGIQVLLPQRSHLHVLSPTAARLAADQGQGLLHVEADGRIERKRARVERVLHEADPGRLATALDDGLHQPASHASLVFRIDADRPDARDGVSLVQEVRADDTSVDLGHHAPDRRVVGQRCEHSGGHLQRRKVAREPVLVVNGAEGLEANPRAGLGVTSLDLSQRYRRTCGRAFGLSHSLDPHSFRRSAMLPPATPQRR